MQRIREQVVVAVDAGTLPCFVRICLGSCLQIDGRAVLGTAIVHRSRADRTLVHRLIAAEGIRNRNRSTRMGLVVRIEGAWGIDRAVVRHANLGSMLSVGPVDLLWKS